MSVFQPNAGGKGFPPSTSASRKRKGALTLLLAGCLAIRSMTLAGEAAPWSEKDTRLASEYLNLLVEKPEYGRVLDLLWELYDKHQSTGFLLENIAQQAKAQPHPSVLLVQAHLLRKSGNQNLASALYGEVLKLDSKNAIALRASVDIAQENGDPVTALEFLRKLTDIYPANDPQRASLLLEQGKLAVAVNQREEAAKLWEQAVKLQPENAALSREVAQLLLSAGFLDQALALYKQLTTVADPEKKLEAFYDLSRLEEQADHFPAAAAALRQGLGLLHFKDWRYAQFFQRLVRLHERFGQLDTLKSDLLQQARTEPPQEKALSDMARFAELTVDPDERLKWLRDLTQFFPNIPDYRWQLVTTLLDHEGWQEAAQLVDAQLKNDGTDLSALVLLRCQAHLRAGEQDKAVARLQQLLAVQGNQEDVEKQVLAFAREKSLDAIVEAILQLRIQRDPNKAEAVFELATHLMKRQRSTDAEKLLDAYINAAGVRPEDLQRRLRETASFFSSSQNKEAAEKAARRAVAHGADRSSLMQLADVLAQHGDMAQAIPLLEKAWALSDSMDKRIEVDEILFSLLAGDQAQKSVPSSPVSGGFKLPSFFSGEGFGSEAPEPKRNGLSEAVVQYAENQVLLCGRKLFPQRLPSLSAVLRLPSWAGRWVDETLNRIPANLPQPDQDRIFRAAWWAARTEQVEVAYALLRCLSFDDRGRAIVASLEVEKLWLELSLSDKNILLALRKLLVLTKLDPGNRTAYLLRLAELESQREDKRGLNEAISILEGLAKEEAQNEAVLSALAELYVVSGKREKALSLWEKAARESKGKNASLVERYAEMLIAQQNFKDFIAAQMRLLDAETDVKQRRDIFQRALERLLWSGASLSQLPEEEAKRRLDLMLTALQERARYAPFDGFWNEALATVYEKKDEPVKAFAQMKQAYYTAPDTPFSLDQLRAAAMRVGDLKSAIYFQKQIAAAAAAKDQAGEWRELVKLLEQDFRMVEADQARRRLETRFSQDPTALDDLATYYMETGQDDASRRVYEQIMRVRPWDTRNLLRLALQQKLLGQTAPMKATLLNLLAITRPAAIAANVPVEKLSWPLLDANKENGAVSTSVLSALDNAPGLEQEERDRLRIFMGTPRAEFTELPEDPEHLRLRAIQEIARIIPRDKFAEIQGLSEMEKAWLLFYGGAGAEFRTFLDEKLAKAETLEAQFIHVWLGMKSHGMPALMTWAHEAKSNEPAFKQRRGLIQSVTTILAEDVTFEFEKNDLTALGSGQLLSNVELIDVARKFEGRQRFELAFALTTEAQRNAPNLKADYAVFLARLAEAMGRTDMEKTYLKQIWDKPLEAGKPEAFDPFIQSFSKLLRLSHTADEKEQLFRESWNRLKTLPPSGQGMLREARILGVAGADQASSRKLSDYLGNDFLTARAFVEPIMGRLPSGTPLGGPRIDDFTHLSGYWDDARNWSDLIKRDGLALPLVTAEKSLDQRFGGIPLGPRSNPDFNSWRTQVMVRQMRFSSYPQRLRLLQQFLEADDQVETLLELGGILESMGFSRECIEIYRRLPERAPSNVEYCEQFLRVCETAWECSIAIPYIEKLFAAEPQFKPQNLAEALLEEKHAKFLARLHDVNRLRLLSFRGVARTKPMAGRMPVEVAYLKELALLLERDKDLPGALAAWEELHALWPEDAEASLHRAQILATQGNAQRALESLREMDLSNLWSEPTRESLLLRVKLAADNGSWDEVREVMSLVSGGTRSAKSTALPHTGSIIAISRIIAAHQHIADAQSLLLRAERSAKDKIDRFRLQLEQLKLAALDPAWSPQRDAARVSAMLRMEHRDRESLREMVQFLDQEAESTRAGDWITTLRTATPCNGNVAVALCSFAKHLEERDTALLIQPWTASQNPNRIAQRVAMESLLKQGKPLWARTLAQTGPGKALAEDPLMIPILTALGDRHALEELYASLVRMSFPGGGDTVIFAEALSQSNRNDLAGELYALAVEQVRASAGTHPSLTDNYARFLIRLHRYEEAESLLLQEHVGMTEGLPKLLVDLYRGWNKTDRLTAELSKFHLPDGVLAETLFLAGTKP
ncbi:hypothetical protein BH11VER1_BH11VER1_26420 [soil metagenome]